MLRIYGQFKVISKGDTKIELIRFLIEHKTHPEKISSDFFKKCVTIRQVDYNDNSTIHAFFIRIVFFGVQDEYS